MKEDESLMANAETGRIFYGWWVVAAAFLNLFFVVGIIFYGFPLHPPGSPSIERADHLKDIKIIKYII